MKKYHTLLLVAISILFVILLTWIIPGTYLQGELIEAGKVQAGIVNAFSYPLFTFYNFIYVFLFLLFVGGFYGILKNIGAYRVILDRIANHVKERKMLCLILTVLLITLVISFTGFTYEAMIILPFIAGIVLLLGYDKITAAMITVGSVGIGIAGSTFSSTVVGAFNETLETTYQDLIWAKVIILVLGAAILILNVFLHTRKIEMKETVEESMLVPKKVTDKNVKVWPLATILIAMIIIMIVARLDWFGAFKITFFEQALETIKTWEVLSKYVLLTVCGIGVLYNVFYSLYKRKKEAKKDEAFMSKRRKIVTIVLGSIAFLALLKVLLEDVFNATKFMSTILEEIKVSSFIKEFTFEKFLGPVVAFGAWTYNDYLLLMIAVFFAIKFSYHIKMEEILNSVGEGYKKVLYAALVTILGYTILIFSSSHPIGLTILKPLLQLTDGLNVLTYPLCSLISGLFSTDFTYFEYGVLNFTYATTFFTGDGVLKLVELITQGTYGLAILIAPTSAVLLFTLSFLDIKYTTWLKKMLITICGFAVVLLASFIVVRFIIG